MAETKQSILITGGNGFIASHIIAQSIEAGYHVTTTLRTEDKSQQLLTLHPEWKENISFDYVPDLIAPHAFDHVLEKKSFDFVMHTASPVTFAVKDIQKEQVDPSVQGTLRMLESAQKLGGTKLKRFVLLGSAVSIGDSFDPMTKPGKPYTEDDWNPVTAADAIKDHNTVLGYNAGKKHAEEAAWKFMSEEKPKFDLVVLCPDIVIGPMIQPVPGPQSVNATNSFAVYSFFNGTNKDIGAVRFPFYHYVDVRDVARAHVLALTASKASNKRVILVSGLITPQLVVDIVRMYFPELRDRMSEGSPGKALPEGIDPTGWDVTRSYEIFGEGWSYRQLEESVVDTVRDILAHEKQWA